MPPPLSLITAYLPMKDSALAHSTTDNEQIDGSTWKSIIDENQIPEQQTSGILHNDDDQDASIQNESSSAVN
ncbi:unnamed protein product [Adineta steineri]|uniref:Uncharacterized protein n=1 Tax=Adineta steineri TaxID=433720 RepID=A0A819H949_9BILA|nr:unnamed protein product [Adineta steineri]CAF3894328.1 unnamed protein product [Adineta steineri]